MKPQISSGLLVRLMNHNESFDELSLNFKHVIKYKSVSKIHFDYIPTYLVIYFKVTYLAALTRQSTDRNAPQQCHLQTAYIHSGIQIAVACTKQQFFGWLYNGRAAFISSHCLKIQAKISCCFTEAGGCLDPVSPLLPSLDLLRIFFPVVPQQRASCDGIMAHKDVRSPGKTAQAGSAWHQPFRGEACKKQYTFTGDVMSFTCVVCTFSKSLQKIFPWPWVSQSSRAVVLTVLFPKLSEATYLCSSY